MHIGTKQSILCYFYSKRLEIGFLPRFTLNLIFDQFLLIRTSSTITFEIGTGFGTILTRLLIDMITDPLREKTGDPNKYSYGC